MLLSGVLGMMPSSSSLICSLSEASSVRLHDPGEQAEVKSGASRRGVTLTAGLSGVSGAGDCRPTRELSAPRREVTTPVTGELASNEENVLMKLLGVEASGDPSENVSGVAPAGPVRVSTQSFRVRK